MKKLLKSTLLTVAAVPFLIAAPTATKNAQNTAAPASKNAATAQKTQKKHVKKSQNSKPAKTDSTAKK